MKLFRLIDAERDSYPASLLCRVLKVSRSGYYGWKDRPLSKTARENVTLAEQIREIHQRSRETHGYPRVHAELRASGVRCSGKRVARLMRKAGLSGCRRGRKLRTTCRDKHAVPAPDLVKRTSQPSHQIPHSAVSDRDIVEFLVRGTEQAEYLLMYRPEVKYVPTDDSGR